MKFFIVTFLKEYQEDVTSIFKQTNIHVFSITDVIGYKDDQSPNLLQDWFASGDEKFDSRMIFCFTTAENAAHGMLLIRQYNEEAKINFPVRAFIIPVEEASF